MTRGSSTHDRTNGHGSDKTGNGEKQTRRAAAEPAKGAKENGQNGQVKNRDRKEVQQLIELGKSKGHLTYDEISEALPSDVFSSDQIDELMGILGDEDIEIVDAQIQMKVAPKRAAEGDQEKRVVPVPEEEDSDFNDAYASKSNDPVRMYLRRWAPFRSSRARAKSRSPSESKTARTSYSTRFCEARSRCRKFSSSVRRSKPRSSASKTSCAIATTKRATTRTTFASASRD